MFREVADIGKTYKTYKSCKDRGKGLPEGVRKGISIVLTTDLYMNFDRGRSLKLYRAELAAWSLFHLPAYFKLDRATRALLAQAEVIFKVRFCYNWELAVTGDDTSPDALWIVKREDTLYAVMLLDSYRVVSFQIEKGLRISDLYAMVMKGVFDFRVTRLRDLETLEDGKSWQMI